MRVHINIAGWTSAVTLLAGFCVAHANNSPTTAPTATPPTAPGWTMKVTHITRPRDISNWQQQIAIDHHEIDDIRNRGLPYAYWNQHISRWQTAPGSPGRAGAQTQIDTLNAKLEHLDTDIAGLQHKIDDSAGDIFVYGAGDNAQPITLYSQNAVAADLALSMQVGGTYRVYGSSTLDNGILRVALEQAVPVDLPASPPAMPESPNSVNTAPASPPSADIGGNTCFSPNELKACTVEPDGTITAGAVPVTLNLPGTEGNDFLITGQIYIGANEIESGNGPHGVLFLLREKDSRHSYDLGETGMRVKRMLLAGQTVSRFAHPIKFKLPRDQWIPVRIDVRESGINASFGDQTGTAPGPLSVEGHNSIRLAPGARIRNMHLTLESSEATSR